MQDKKQLLLQGNDAIARRDHEAFLSLCTDDTEWVFVGERTLSGRQAVRDWMAETYIEPPRVRVDNLILDGDYLTAVGKIEVLQRDGTWRGSHYCDVWRFADDKLASLRAFVIAA